MIVWAAHGIATIGVEIIFPWCGRNDCGAGCWLEPRRFLFRFVIPIVVMARGSPGWGSAAIADAVCRDCGGTGEWLALRLSGIRWTLH